MTNAKEEFIRHIEDREVLAAKIQTGSEWNDKDRETYLLQKDYTSEQYQEFLKSIDFEYDSGYGGQELFGNIWYSDKTWSSRGEYDGSEWWKYNKCPEIDF